MLSGIRKDAGPDMLEKTHAELLALLAYVQAQVGRQAESDDALSKAAIMARRFDSMPEYSLKAMRFAEQMDNSAFFDILGASASGSIAALLGLLKDESLAEKWKEMTEYV